MMATAVRSISWIRCAENDSINERRKCTTVGRSGRSCVRVKRALHASSSHRDRQCMRTLALADSQANSTEREQLAATPQISVWSHIYCHFLLLLWRSAGHSPSSTESLSLYILFYFYCSQFAWHKSHGNVRRDRDAIHLFCAAFIYIYKYLLFSRVRFLFGLLLTKFVFNVRLSTCSYVSCSFASCCFRHRELLSVCAWAMVYNSDRVYEWASKWNDILAHSRAHTHSETEPHVRTALQPTIQFE